MIRVSDETDRKEILTLESMAPKVTVGPAYTYADLLRDDLKRTRDQYVDAVHYVSHAEQRGSHHMVVSHLRSEADRLRRICEQLEARLADHLHLNPPEPVSHAAE